MDFLDKAFTDAKNYIMKFYDKGEIKETMLWARKKNEEDLLEFLEKRVDEDDWPHMSPSEWQELVEHIYKMREESKPVIIPNKSDTNVVDIEIPRGKDASWQSYKNSLLEKGYSEYDVSGVETSAHAVLNRLHHEQFTDADHSPVKGLVIGNVQSGKTTCMEALITMIAEYGWNVVVLLTGNKNNLKNQTVDRIRNDLVNLKCDDYAYDVVDFSSQKLSLLDLSSDAKRRYIIPCLKQQDNLKDLWDWLNSDCNKKQQMKVLVIDDEADQAGMNGGNIYDADTRTAINTLLLKIVNNESNIPYYSMSYVQFTATPYANILCEPSISSDGVETLFPKDFIGVLNSSERYFGPQEIFGNSEAGGPEGMPIICNIPGEYSGKKDDGATADLGIMEKICKDTKKTEIPKSLKDAIAWFCIATAIMRFRKLETPATMLVHHIHTTGSHNALAEAIFKWLSDVSQTEFIKLCERVYNNQTNQFPKKTFLERCQFYGKHSNLDLEQAILDYPSFDDFSDEIKSLHNQKIQKNYGKKALKYGKGIHICVDNAADNSAFARLTYPDQKLPGITTPAFLVVGGNTLSRGLTLEGLVSTYFSREVKQADSLMQMGRWFGYRIGYELLPRIWMHKAAEDRFVFLAKLDADLRERLAMNAWESPLAVEVSLLQVPGVYKMKLTGKQQAAEETDISFAGVNTQSVYFDNDKTLLSNNLKVADTFIKDLGKPDIDHPGKLVWKGISHDVVWNNFLKKVELKMSGGTLVDLDAWMKKSIQAGKISNWNVVLSGTIPKSGIQKNKLWHGKGKVTRSRKLTGAYAADGFSLNIGVLADPKDWAADIEIDKIKDIGLKKRVEDALKAKSDANGKKKAETNAEKKMLRNELGLGKIPLIAIYCIDKDSEYIGNATDRCSLKTVEDLIGVSIRIPEVKSEQTRLKNRGAGKR